MTDSNARNANSVYRFGEFELDPGSRELRYGGVAQDVQKKVLDLLIFLIEARERAITKDEVIAAVWPRAVVTDAVLTRAVMKARKALAADPVAADAIRTIRGHGYRFVASVTESRGPGQIASPPDDTESRNPSRVLPGSSVSERPSVVVLPFENLSGDTEQAYFADGIASDLITQLGRYRWLDVIARNAAFTYRDKSVDVRHLARDLGVSYVVEGSLRKSGSRIRVTAELTDANTGRHLWGEKYDRDLADVFEIQDEITRTLVGRLEPEIGLAERQKVASVSRPDLAAWEAFHLGMLNFYRFTSEANERARALFEQARRVDPRFGEAHAWWAYATVLGMVYWDTEPEPALLDAALEATQRALATDDQNAVFYALKARVQLARCEYDAALAENEIAIRLNPSLAVAYCGLGDSLAYEGRYSDAVERFESAIELSPNDPQRWAFLSYGALALLFKGDFDGAVRWADRALEVPNCQFWALAHKLVAMAHAGRSDEYAAVKARLLAERPGFTIAFARRKLFYLKRPEQKQVYLEGLAIAGIPAN